MTYKARYEFIVGVPEITVQMLIFSWLLVRWESKSKTDLGSRLLL